ncbi:uncharacterized protein ELE39_003246 [Cryptosporidium sp. chipmunk genotype I]|uniref:uncharacterized protein n=1 Tax=Cryptosporidium sp. chipmunk genotype I TaxID=1280935 RepID=UPI00351A85E4|nr:hypothetical protein ELE39_003246 [Cryptosporidium sp. chipmunk genotype I]
MIVSNEIERGIPRIELGGKVVVSPLKLELLENVSNYSKSQSLNTINLSFHEMSQRGMSSTESLEHQDKYITPEILSDDNESDVERARIVEEAALVAEKLMSSQLSKINYETKLRTMETRFPTRVNSPRYYNEKREVMDRANRILMNGRREFSSIPGFFQNKLGWFGCVENFFSVCNDEQIIEDNESCSFIEANPYFSPKKRSSTDKNMKILEELKVFNNDGKASNSTLDEGRKTVKKITSSTNEGNSLKTESFKKLVSSEKSSTVSKVTDINSSNTKKTTQAREPSKSSKPNTEVSSKCKVISESNSYDIENDVFYLDDGAGYITFNASKLDFSEMEKGSNTQTTMTKQMKDSNGLQPASLSSKSLDTENQRVSAFSLVNMSSENAKKSPTRCKTNFTKTNQINTTISEKTQSQISPSDIPKKECKKKLRAIKLKNLTELDGTKIENSNTDQNILNYSSNCIRGRMDYISTDVFV